MPCCTANASDKQRYKWRDALQIFAPTLWPIPSQVKLVNIEMIEYHKFIIIHDQPAERTGRMAQWGKSVHCYSETPTLKIGQCLLSEVCRAVKPQVLGQGKCLNNINKFFIIFTIM